jgi:hypothetical protein
VDLSFTGMLEFDEHAAACVDGDALFGLISASAEASEFFGATIKVGATLNIESGHVDTYTAELYPTSQLQPDGGFTEAVTGLPAEWWSPLNWGIFKQHFATYGTHFINAISAGGNYHYSSICNSEYLHAEGSAQASADAGADFLGLLKADGAFSGDVHAATELYHNSCTVSVTCLGGNGQCHSNSTSTYNAWVDSVHENPWMTDARYTLNSDLLGGMPVQRLVHESASVAYIAWAGLKRLSEIMQAVRAALQMYADMDLPTCSDAQYNCHKNATEATANITLVKENAAYLINHTGTLTQQLNDTLALLRTSAKIDSFSSNLPAWQEQVYGHVSSVFSGLTTVSCEGTTATICGTHLTSFGCVWCIGLGCVGTTSCVWDAGAGNCVRGDSNYPVGTAPAPYAYTSPPIPQALLQPL